jgi:hypothetical protein
VFSAVLRIRDVYPGSQIPEPTTTKEGGGMCVEYFCLAFFVLAINFTKLKSILFLNRFRKIFEPIYKKYNIFYPKYCH